MKSLLAEKLEAAAADAGGALLFEDFMQTALYEPGLGFYERSERGPGRWGDFLTSVSVGPLFGELVAWRVGGWLEAIPGPVRWIEAGAHDGRFASDVLAALERLRPALAERLEYWLVEPSEVRRAWQRERLSPARSAVRWFSDLAAVRAERPRGALVVNELLDAFPLRRWIWDKGESAWLPLGVRAGADGFQWVRLGASRAPKGSVPALPPEFEAVLPDGFTLDESPSAEAWWGEAASALDEGWMAAFDYELGRDARLHPARHAGVLRAYRGHHMAPDPLAHPGETDLTAPVDFAALAAAASAAGARWHESAEQGRWLAAVVRDAEGGRGPSIAWDAAKVRQFQTLTHPDHLGRQFKVLVQRKDRGVA